MNKLTIHHLARRLPYGLAIKTIDGFEIMEDILGSSQEVYGRFKFWDIDDCKPYLRPLSQLTEEIEHNGEKFVPLYQLEVLIAADYGYNWQYVVGMLKNKQMGAIPFEVSRKLQEWHFRIDEPEGSYIEVTPENNPYK